MITRKHIAFSPGETIEEFSNDLLQRHVKYCYENSPFYRRRLDEVGVRPDQISGKNDLRLIPLTTKFDLERYNREFLCVGEDEIVDLCQTSGTTDRPINMLQTAGDIDRFGYNEEISFQGAGITRQDKVMIACAMGRCFMAGLAYFEGVRRIGATALRVGSGNCGILAQAALDHRPSVIVCVPSQALSLAQAIEESGVAPASLGVRLLICIGEPIRTPQHEYSHLGASLKTIWACDIAGTYASTEMATSFTDCTSGCGGHFHPELIIVEVIDDDGNILPPGIPGEIVATPLQVTGMPLLRYCMGDIAACHSEPCSCGRNTFRLGAIIGRKQQKMKIRCTTIYPSTVYSVLQQIAEIDNYYLEVFDDHKLSERIRVVVGVANKGALSTQALAEKIRSHIRVRLEVAIEDTELVASRIIQEGKRKPVLFFDYRNK